MKNQSQPLVSIIIPVYNCEEFINVSLKSITKQTYKNIEIICIDDCSLDNSYNELKKFAKANKNINIRIIKNKNNIGTGQSRNKGIKESKGKYICFIDADDTVSTYFVEDLLKTIIKEQADIVQCQLVKIDEFGKINDPYPITKLNNDNTYYSFSKENAYKHIPINNWVNYITPHICNKIYRKEFLYENSIWFNHTKCMEDTDFIYKAISFSKKTVLIPKLLYFYNYSDNTTSVTRSQDFNRQSTNFSECLSNIISIIKHKNYNKPEIKEHLSKALLNNIRYTLSYFYTMDNHNLGIFLQNYIAPIILDNIENLNYYFPKWRNVFHLVFDKRCKLLINNILNIIDNKLTKEEKMKQLTINKQ